jgi:hypothetical protein
MIGNGTFYDKNPHFLQAGKIYIPGIKLRDPSQGDFMGFL